MKAKRVFISSILLFLVLIVGCSNGIKNEGNKIIVEKQVAGTDKYELYHEIKDDKEVKKIKNILNSTIWENAKVSMAKPPDYRFHFEGISAKNKSN